MTRRLEAWLEALRVYRHPRVLAMLGSRAQDLIQEEDRELFACAFESHLER